MTAHARYSPSGFSGWSNCAGWQSNPVGSKDADHGTDAHELKDICAKEGKPAAAYEGRVMSCGNVVDAEMVEAVQRHLDLVASLGGAHHSEIRVPISQITGEDGAAGTADDIVLRDGELVVVDLKYGANPNNKVMADDGQLKFYAHGALELFGMVEEFKTVRLIISQPRLQHVDEVVYTVEQLNEWAAGVAIATEIVPGDKQCKWCVKKATCEALADKVQITVGAMFAEMVEGVELPEPADDLPTKMAAVDLIEEWCKAVRAEVERRLLTGQPVPGYKLVEGRRGARQWASKDEAEAALKAMRLKVEEMYELSLISPTKAEKLAKDGAIGPRQWPKLQTLITQADGKPSVAPESDKRKAIEVGPRQDVFNDLIAA